MNPQKRELLEHLYQQLKNGRTILGVDHARGIGVVALVEERQGQVDLVPIAEITFPTFLPAAIEE